MAKVLVIGSGGREHALSWRLAQSPAVKKVFCAPGNAGIAQDVTCLELPTYADIVSFCRREPIDLVVIGPEQPLVDGLADRLVAEGIPTFGPSAKAAQLEGSKGFMKNLCAKYDIPTAAYGYFHSLKEARDFLSSQRAPIVVKADGLAAGKGVVIAQTLEEAQSALEDMFAGAFGDSGKAVVIEEFMEGPEVSYFALTDGTNAVEFAYAQDHKRVGDGDTGPNTGGMGAFSPPQVMTPSLRRQVMEQIILPTVRAMAAEGSPFCGVLFAGLMLTKDGPKLLEYNARFGDPETQAMMARYDGCLFKALLACANGQLDRTHISLSPKAAVCVVMAADGYPGHYEKGTVIRGLERAATLPDVKIFHAGTSMQNGDIIATGGRVLGVTALGDTMQEAQRRAYQAVDAIEWPEGFCRRDIGWREINA